MNLQKVGKFIAKMRKKVGMTQSDLGEALGVTGKAVSKWERGLNAPDITVLVELAKLLNVSPTEILVGENIDSEIPSETADEITVSTINTYNNFSKKKYTKVIVILVSIIILIITAFSTTYFITNYNKCFVYKLSSADEKYHLEGLIASNQKENSIIISGLMIGNNYELSSVNKYEVRLVINDVEIFKKMYLYNNQCNSNYFNDINLVINNNQVISWDENKRKDKNRLIITFYQDNSKIKKIIIPIQKEKKFSNDKLFY